MSDAPSSRPAADRNLLFGILALQMDFITRDALVAAMQSWVFHKETPLGQILAEQGVLSTERRTLLEALVQEHLKQHGNDAEKSLAAVSSLGSVRHDLERLADADVQASLAGIPPTKDDEYATHTPSSLAANDPNATVDPASQAPTMGAPRYRILRPHAKGGLGEVFVARDEELNREVALKEIQDRHADHPESRSRFLLEAEITGGLEHPGIVPVYGLGTYADGRPYYAMRFIKGDSLKEAIERFHRADVPGRDPGDRALAQRQLLRRFVDVCNAIAYAHSRGILHRDLKPGNIMLGQYGETLVVDWGLAKLLGHRAEKTETGDVTLLPRSASGSAATLMGSAIGTPAYMSPEQAAGRLDELGTASDVYSLGATLYCLLTGKPPIEERDAGLVLRRVEAGDFPPPRRVKPDVQAALEAICLKAMARKPQDRYPGPRDLADDIEHWLADEPISALPESWWVKGWRWGRRHRTILTTVLVALLVALAGLGTSTLLLTAANERERQAKENAEREKDKAEQALESRNKARVAMKRFFAYRNDHPDESIWDQVRAFERISPDLTEEVKLALYQEIPFDVRAGAVSCSNFACHGDNVESPRYPRMQSFGPLSIRVDETRALLDSALQEVRVSGRKGLAELALQRLWGESRENPGAVPPPRKGAEYRHWLTRDKHAQAYEVLFHDPAKRIARLLGIGNAHESPRCLSCHAPGHTRPEPGTDLSSAQAISETILDGVSCAACHGPPQNWLREHSSKAFKELSDTAKREKGFFPTKSLAFRAKLCASCHVGSDGNQVDHDMIAAGHPWSPFELTSSLDRLAKHWDETHDRATYPDYPAPAWALGQMASARAAVRLLEYRARTSSLPWPEFAEYRCFACHANLKFNARDSGGRRPGSLPWSTLYTAQLREVVLDEQGLVDRLHVTDILMQSPYPDRTKVSTLAHEVGALLDKKMDSVDRDSADPMKLRSSVERVVRGWLDPGGVQDWEHAVQVVFALTAYYRAIASRIPDMERRDLEGDLTQMGAAVQFKSRFEGPVDFDPKNVTRLFDDFERKFPRK